MTRIPRLPAGQIVLLVAVLVVGLAGGATAKAGFDANNARNADKVDGRHAVSAGSSPSARRGKLVATSPGTGRLPNNIIGKAPDSAKLGGVPARSLKRLTFPITSGGVQGSGATAFIDEVDLSSTQDGTVSWTFLLPADRKAGDPIRAQILYQEGSPAACSWVVQTGGIVESEGGFANSAWRVPGNPSFSGPITVPAGDTDAHRATFQFASSQWAVGNLVSFTLSRDADNGADTCMTIRMRGVQFFY